MKRTIQKVIRMLASDIGVPGIFIVVIIIQIIVITACTADKKSLNLVLLPFYVYVLIVLNYKFDGSAIFLFFFCPFCKNFICYLSY